MTVNIVDYKPSCSNPVSFPTRQYVNNGMTKTKGGMPAKFRGADGGASFAMGRSLYSNTTLANESYNLASLTDAFNKKKICTCTASCNHMQCTCKFNSGKAINVQSSDQYIQRIKNRAIGRGSTPSQTKDDGSYKLSFRSQDYNTVRSALRRNRNSGAVPPPKVGARIACKSN